jgi:DNA-binding CsgD family transcriptional regulator
MQPEVFARDPELAIVRAFLARAAAGPLALVLEGEAGIGKSTLWLAGVAGASVRYAHVLTSRPAEAERSLAHVVLGDLFESLPAEHLAALPVPRRAALEAALLVGQREVRPFDPRALAAAVGTVLASLAREGPVLVAVDDEQWADRASIASLVFALRRLRQVPLRILVSRRVGALTEPSPDDEGLEQAIEPEAVERLYVGPLSLGATSLLLQHRFAVRLSRPDLLRIHEASNGNPFFALELARAQALRSSGAVATLFVPDGIERLLAPRLDGVDGEQRAALLFVAAEGRPTLELLRQLGVARSTLERAAAAGLVEISEAAVRFTHPLLASTLYQRADADARRLAHRQLAATVVDPIDRARHLALAAEGPDEATATLIEAAAVVARARGAAATAAELAEHAAGLTPPRALDDKLRRRTIAARAHLEAGEVRRARETAEAILADAPGGSAKARALVLSAELEHPKRSVELLRQAIPEVRDDPALEATIRVRLAEVGRLTMDRAAAEREARAALQLADDAGDETVRVYAQSVLAILRFHAGEPDALELAREAYRGATELGDPELTRVTVSNVGHVLVWSRRIEEAREWLEGALRDEADRDEVLRGECHWHLSLAEIWGGRWTVADDHAKRAIELSVVVTAPQDYFPEALLALYRGELARARDLATKAIELSVGMIMPGSPAILAIADLWAGAPAAATERFADVEAQLDARGVRRPEWLLGRPEHIEALLQVGRIDDATRLLSSWTADVRRSQGVWAAAEVARLQGMVAAAQGDLGGAIARLDDAGRRLEAAGDPFGRGRALLALGSTYRRRRQKRQARLVLDQARRTFDDLGAALFASAARAELARLGGRRRVEGLSASERRVAEMAVAGRTNREIASALYLGERTVASHLAHAYAKLGVRSRTELAHRLATDASAAAPPAPG